jgi:signal transduction histidine kinase
MRQTIAREFHRAEETGIAFGSWWTQEGGRLDNPESLQSVIPFLEKGAIITNLVLSRSNGDSACVVRKDKEWNLVLFKAGQAPKSYLVKQGRWVPEAMSAQYLYEARERPWYRFGAAQTVPSWTPDAYRYYTSSVAGYTFTVPIRDPQGVLQGVIGVDVSLEELTQLIWANQPTPNARLIVTDPAGRLLVPPQLPQMKDFSTRLANHLLPLPATLLNQLQRGDRVAPAGESSHLLDPGQAYVSTTVPFSSEGTPHMNLHIAIPEDDLFPGQHRFAVVTFILALAAVLGVAWTLLELHRRVVQPIRQLAENLEPSGGDPDQPMNFNSDIWELQRVGEKLHLAGRTDQEMKRLMHTVEHSQRVDSVGAMAPGIVHDVNNQLTMVLGQISICRTLLDTHPELQPHLSAAEGATIKCGEVLRALMDYSRPNHGHRELLSLNTVVNGAVELLRRVVHRSVQVELDLDRSIPTLFGEPIKLQQVIVNLGLNARDAMPDGGTLLFRTYRAEENLCLEVRDTGCGMSQEVKQRLFEPFFTTKDPDKGTGLGLAMVANIVSAHAGVIQVESEPSAGTVFRISFPPSLRKRVDRLAMTST